MADLFASLLPVRLNDGVADANNAKVLAAAPASGDYALAVRQVGVAAAAALADATANPTVISLGTFLLGYNGTTWDRLRSTTANGLAVDVTRVQGTVTVDSELPAAAALADATANPTTPIVGAAVEIFNGTTWDRRRSIAAAMDTTGTGIAASGILGQLDDTATSAVTENQFAPVRISTRRALLVEGVASGTNLNVNLAASAATVTVDSELLAAAAMADATANPTITQIAGYLMGFNGTTWDRVRTANTGRLQVDVVTGGGSNASVFVDNAAYTPDTSSATVIAGLFDDTAGAALTENDVAAARIDSKRALMFVGEDATTRGQKWAISASGALSANLTAVGGSAIAIGQAAMAASLPVVIASNQSAVTVDSELPAAAALGDATANPTVPGVGGFILGFNGTTWDRIRTANTGRLQVDVVTGGSSPAPSELPSGYNMIDVYGSTSGTAAAGNADVATNTPANTKQVYVRQVSAAASGATKVQLKFGATIKWVGFLTAAQPTGLWRFDPPIPVTGDGATVLAVNVTNREASAMDLYARINAIVQA